MFSRLTEAFLDIRAMFRARRNRSRHPDLVKKYRNARSDVDRFIIAQEMLERDSDKLHEMEDQSQLQPEDWPIVWDYHVPSTRIWRINVRMRRKARYDELYRLKADTRRPQINP